MNKTAGVFARIINNEKGLFGVQTSFFEALSREGLTLGLTLHFFSVESWQKTENCLAAFQFDGSQWSPTKIPIPHIVYDRCFPDKDSQAATKALRQFLRDQTIMFAIPTSLARLTGSKLKFNRFLIKHNIPHIKTFSFKRMKTTRLQSLLNEHGTVYLKPSFGMGGQGIVVIQKLRWNRVALHFRDGARKVISTEQLLPQLEACQDFSRYIVQPSANAYGFENSPVCIRVLVQNTEKNNYQITGSVSRVGAKKAWLAVPGPQERALPLHEMANYYKRVYQKDIFEEKARVESLCMDCTHKLHEKYGSFLELGFDIMLTKEQGPVILEANSAPGRTIFGKMADAYPIGSEEYAEYKAIQSATIRRPAMFINSLFS